MIDTHDQACETDPRLRDFFGKLDAAIKTHQAELKSFFAGLGPAVDIAKRAQAELDRIAATQFSIFPYFNMGELDLSRIFADLLDLSGRHGQDDRFLRLFRDEFSRDSRRAGGPGEGDSSLRPFLDKLSSSMSIGRSGLNHKCEVHLEFPTREHREKAPGRIDIVLKMPNGLWIGIENKPWAEDRERQIARYLKDLKERGTAWILYFSGDGKKPNEWRELEREDQDRCLTVPYRRGNDDSPSLEHWIERCREQCEAEVVRWFLKDLLKYIREQFEFRAHDVSDAEENGDAKHYR